MTRPASLDWVLLIVAVAAVVSWAAGTGATHLDSRLIVAAVAVGIMHRRATAR